MRPFSCARGGLRRTTVRARLGLLVRTDGPDEVRYEFGFQDRFDRVLIINPRTLEARAEDCNFNSAASSITAKIANAWRAGGQWPPGMIFAS